LIFLVWLSGLCFGSFANVCICRGIKNESILGRSYCPSCRTQLQVFDLIPLLSWIYSKGKCRYCKGEISWQYPLIELICAAAWTVIYLYAGSALSLEWLIYSLIAIVFIIIAGMDFLDKESGIDDRYILVGAILITFLRLYLSEEIDLLTGAAAGFCFSGATYLIGKILYVAKGVSAYGEGDILVCILIGGLVGWKGFYWIYLSACILAVVWNSTYSIIARKRDFLHITSPFAPFLIFAMAMVLVVDNLPYLTIFDF
jgi:leader peptidase (prepilin peptidase)/N-methyltransferase